MHIDILDMAAAFKFEIRRAQLTARQEAEPGDDDVTVSLVADLQEEQDRESEAVLAQLSDKVRVFIPSPPLWGLWQRAHCCRWVYCLM